MAQNQFVRFKSTFWILAAFLPLLLCRPTPDLPNGNSSLLRRQCVHNADGSGYDCDDLLPTVDEMVARFRDTEDGGLATAENRAVFVSCRVASLEKCADGNSIRVFP